jgi:hypothetical protein
MDEVGVDGNDNSLLDLALYDVDTGKGSSSVSSALVRVGEYGMGAKGWGIHMYRYACNPRALEFRGDEIWAWKGRGIHAVDNNVLIGRLSAVHVIAGFIVFEIAQLRSTVLSKYAV